MVLVQKLLDALQNQMGRILMFRFQKTIVLIGILLISIQGYASLTPKKQQRIIFDVKTSFVEKSDLMAAKLGVTIFLLQSEWASVSDVGEKFSVWLQDYSREQRGNRIYISFDVEIRTPAMVRRGNTLDKQRISFNYAIDSKWNDVNTTGQAIITEIENLSTDMQNEAYLAGEAVVKYLKKYAN